MSANIVVVHGATGHLGRYVVDDLLARGHPKGNIVTPVRKLDEDPAKELKALGVKVVWGDLHDQASLEAAYKGAHTVVFIPIRASTLDRIKAAEYSIAAAQTAKIQRFLAVSAGNGRADSANLGSASYLHLDAATRAASVPWLIVKMGLFVEIYDRDFKSAAETGVFTFPAIPAVRLSFISRRDIAAGITAAVLQWDLVGREFVLTGPTAPSLAEIAGFIGKITGKKVAFKEVSVPDYQKELEPEFGPLAGRLAVATKGFGVAALKGEFSITNDMYELTGKTAEPLEKYLAGLLRAKQSHA